MKMRSDQLTVEHLQVAAERSRRRAAAGIPIEADAAKRSRADPPGLKASTMLTR